MPTPVATAPAAPARPATSPAPTPVVAPVPAPSKPWVVQPVKVDANAQAASVAEALQTGKYPERLSALIQPKAFDQASYDQDPLKYLNTVEPGRCFQSAQPGPGVPEIKPVGVMPTVLPRGGSVDLRVQTQPHAPCSFTAMDLGSFSNHLNATTVAADAAGVATATFTASPGVVGMASVNAASPVATGRVRFQIMVEGPLVNPVPEAP